MIINRKNVETGFVCLCYIIGIGSILFGSLSGNEYGDYFVTVGVLALILFVIHASRRRAEYKENKNSNEDSNRNSANH